MLNSQFILNMPKNQNDVKIRQTWNSSRTLSELKVTEKGLITWRDTRMVRTEVMAR